ncbi:MAG: hypothetical protein A3F67_05505 [Verrucomicrobia bacterium RIFCSPHIGHO2_12_FULL_41_10]|nr:MAG: hypothetical protein A3F67_05505 [Verrucomicrobia bacterium RIFCSPHIGHO2_12_FULL_41_10]
MLSWNGLFAETSLNLEDYPITVSEYCAFLNAVGSTDTHHLYNPKMGSEAATCNLLPTNSPLIIRSGSPGSYYYSIPEGCEELPITYVTYFSAARFCNWLENNQPEGDQDTGTTETGTYTFQEEEIIDLNSHAICSLPSKEQYEQLFKKSLITRLPSKLAYADEVQGVDGAQKLSVQELLDTSSTGATKQFAAEVEYQVVGRPRDRLRRAELEQPEGRAERERASQFGRKSTTDSNEEKISYWTSSLENEDSYSIWNPSLVSEQNQQTSSMDPSCAGFTIGFCVITHHDNITDPLPKPSPSASHTKSTVALLKKTGAWTLYSGEFVLFNVAPEIIEVILYEKMKLWFLLPYVGVMGTEISYALLKGDTALATTIALHMIFDISVILADQFFNFDLATKTAELLEQCGLPCVSTFFSTIHNRIHDFIEYLGIEHSHGATGSEIIGTSQPCCSLPHSTLIPNSEMPEFFCGSDFKNLPRNSNFKPQRISSSLQPIASSL